MAGQSAMQFGVQPEYKTGIVLKDNGKFGFIQIDDDPSQEPMFFLPMSCDAWGKTVPPVGTPVKFTVTVDIKTGRARAEEVLPADIVLQEGQEIGTMFKDNGTFGFIMQDSNKESMFVMPGGCQAIGGVFPPVGTRLKYFVVMDEKTQRPRAENVELLEVQVPQALPADTAAQMACGTISKVCENFGFILQDQDQTSMFVMPAACLAFGGQIPPVGTHVMYEVTVDAKTGRPRAENVQPVPGQQNTQGFGRSPKASDFAEQLKQGMAKMMGMVSPSPQISAFASQAARGLQSVAVPQKSAFSNPASFPQKSAFSNPASLGMGLSDQSWNPVKGMGLSDQSWNPDQGMGMLDQTWNPVQNEDQAYMVARANLPPGMESGIFETDNGKFGFIKQDRDGSTMFVMPAACAPWGSIFPPVGTAVKYSVIADPKTGRPRAEGVQPLVGQTKIQELNESIAQFGDVQLTGSISKDHGHYGFLQQDSDLSELFVLPLGCIGFGKQLPPVGTRVCYEVVTDMKTGRPRAENVAPEGADVSTYGKASSFKGLGAQNRSQPYDVPGIGLLGQTGEVVQPKVTGVMMSHNNDGKFGFITLDSGEGTMFVMPQACTVFGNTLPPVGMHVRFHVVPDPKTGRPRAEDVDPVPTQNATVATDAMAVNTVNHQNAMNAMMNAMNATV